MPTVRLPDHCLNDAQLYPALADRGVADDGLVTRDGVEIADAETLAFIRAHTPLVIDEPAPKSRRPDPSDRSAQSEVTHA